MDSSLITSTITTMGEKKRRLAVEPPHSQTALPDIVPIHESKVQQLLETGRQANRRGQLIEAINAYQAALKLAPGLVEAQHFQGLALLQLGQRALGLNLLCLSIAQAPANAMFHFNLGNALRDNKPEAALTALRQAAMLEPDDHECYIVLAEVAFPHQVGHFR
jgi:tetratricopeptide (TPR) repeat protein